jgi:nucleoside-diphosphate-sugar epimerase
MNELVGTICHALGTSMRPFHVPAIMPELMGKFGDLLEKRTGISLPIKSDIVKKLSRTLTFSCEKSKKILGYQPVETLERGIRKEVEWLYPEIRPIGFSNVRIRKDKE